MRPTAEMFEQLNAAKEAKKVADRRAENQRIEAEKASRIRAQIERASEITLSIGKAHQSGDGSATYTTPWTKLEDHTKLIDHIGEGAGYIVQGRLVGIYKEAPAMRKLLSVLGMMPETLITDLHCVQLHIRPVSYDEYIAPTGYDYPYMFSAHNNLILMDPTGHDAGAIQAPTIVEPESAAWEEISRALDRFAESSAKS